MNERELIDIQPAFLLINGKRLVIAATASGKTFKIGHYFLVLKMALLDPNLNFGTLAL